MIGMCYLYIVRNQNEEDMVPALKKPIIHGGRQCSSARMAAKEIPSQPVFQC